VTLPPVALQRDIIDKYHIVYPVGQGGMASVHVGRLGGLAGFEKLVAIKVVHQHLMNERAFLEMFFDEARLAAQIKHPNVAETYALCEEDGLYYMVGELVLGQNLRTVIRRGESTSKPLSLGQIAFIGAEVCRGLHAAHDVRGPDGEVLGLVHRDVTPRNVLISYSGHVKLIDFGVAWAKGKLSHTRSGAVKGKMAYMSPEQLRGFALDRRSDIYSLGVVLYVLTTGTHPFPGASAAERMTRIVEGKFSPPRAVKPELPEELERIILEAMAYSVDDRFENAEAMAEELEAFLRARGEPAGAGALSKHMVDLFRDEMNRHDELMRAHRRKRGESDLSGSQRLSRSPTTSRVPLPSYITDANSSFTGASRTSIRRASKRRALFRKAMAVAIPAGIVIIAAAAYLSGTMQRDGRAAPEPVQPTEKHEQAAESLEGTDSSSAMLAATEVSITLKGLPAVGHYLSLDGHPVSLTSGKLVLPADHAEHILDIEAEGYLKRSMLFKATSDLVLDAELRRIERTRGKKVKNKNSSKNSAKIPPKKGRLRRNPYQ
jgi:serine/threonine-protein kinase